MSTDSNVLPLDGIPPQGVDIDRLDVSERWKKYFKAVQSLGGLQQMQARLKAMTPDARKGAMKDAMPPMASSGLAFVFGLFYYIAKGMWKKGLVLLAIVIPVVVVLSFLFYMIGGESLANATRFVGGAIFAFMAPRDFYAFKVDGDDGWMPTRPF